MLKFRLGTSYRACKPQVNVVNSPQLLLVSFLAPSFEALLTSESGPKVVDRPPLPGREVMEEPTS